MLKRSDYAEKRQFGRRHTNTRAWIRVAGRPPVSCTVQNVSEGGALLVCDEEIWLPFSFRLTTEDRQIDRVCEIRHQTGPRIGVEFVAYNAAQDAAPRILDDADRWRGTQTPRR